MFPLLILVDIFHIIRRVLRSRIRLYALHRTRLQRQLPDDFGYSLVCCSARLVYVLRAISDLVQGYSLCLRE